MNVLNQITLGDLIQKSSYATFGELERLLKVMTSSTPEIRSSHLHLHIATWKKRMILLLAIIKWLLYEKGLGSQFLIDTSNMEEKIISRHSNMDRGIDSLFYVHASLYAKRIHAASLTLAKDILASGTYPFLPQGIFQFGNKQDPPLIEKDLLVSEFRLAIHVRIMNDKEKLLSSSLINSIRITNGKVVLGKSHYYRIILTLESSYKNSKWKVLDSDIMLSFGKNIPAKTHASHFKFYRNKFHKTLFSSLVSIAGNGGGLYELCATCMYNAQSFLIRFLQIDSTNMLQVFRDEIVGYGNNCKNFNHSMNNSFTDKGGVLSEDKNVTPCEFLRWDLWHHPIGRFHYIVLLQQPRINSLAKLDNNNWVDTAAKPIQITLFALWQELDHVEVSKFLQQLSLGKVDNDSPFKVDGFNLLEKLDLYAIVKQMNGVDAGSVQQYILYICTKHRLEPIFNFLKTSQLRSWLKDNMIHFNEFNTASGRCLVISNPCETYKYTLEVCGITGAFQFDKHIASNLGTSRDVSKASTEVLSELNEARAEHLIAKSSRNDTTPSSSFSSFREKNNHDTADIGSASLVRGALLNSSTCSHIIMLSASMVLGDIVDSIMSLLNIPPSAEYPLHVISKIDFEDEFEMKNGLEDNQLGRALVLKTWKEMSPYSPIYNDYNRYNPENIQIEVTTRVILYTTVSFPKSASLSSGFMITFWGIISTFEEGKSHGLNVSNSRQFYLCSFQYTEYNKADLSNVVFEIGVSLFDIGKEQHLQRIEESFTEGGFVMPESLKLLDSLRTTDIMELSHNKTENECVVFLSVSNSIQIDVSYQPNDNIKVVSSQHSDLELSTFLVKLYLADSIQKYVTNSNSISSTTFTKIACPYLFNNKFVLCNQSKGFLGEILTLSLKDCDHQSSYFLRLCLMPKAITSLNSLHSSYNDIRLSDTSHIDLGLECTGISCGNMWQTNVPEQLIWGQALSHRATEIVSSIFLGKFNENDCDLPYAEELICWNLIIIALSRSFIAHANSSAIFITKQMINQTTAVSDNSTNIKNSSKREIEKEIKVKRTDAEESSSYSNFTLNIQDITSDMRLSLTWLKNHRSNDVDVNNILIRTNNSEVYKQKHMKSSTIIISLDNFWNSSLKDVLEMQ